MIAHLVCLGGYMLTKAAWDRFTTAQPQLSFKIEQSVNSYQEKDLSVDGLKQILSELPDNLRPDMDNLLALELWITLFVQKIIIGI